ncbi:peptidase M16 [Pedobacter yulinensis]|uniref:Peptidase M16 n=1 Tax=Pedobacter yulinensis TaxID=2126353 RepID=A0A2T3HRG6_9SPHI|nr:pitrilysin family protein [Pedobacter yulinensis]PST85019.1 peptidase M16 [Pedobacter yulinensis]
MEYFVHTLPNGIRILAVPAASSISHACVIVNAGSRDEPQGKDGLAHFIEHLLFKRTAKRNTSQILNRLESVGADLNAYTTKEYTCVHASFLQPYLDRSLELFQDILFQSVFPEDEMEKEKNVILDEIASYRDQPEEAINDDFEDLLFAGHSLGRNILGTTDTVPQLNRQDIHSFITENYRTDQIVVAILGNYKAAKVFKLGEKYFGEVREKTTGRDRNPPQQQPAVQLTEEKPIFQSHVLLGKASYSIHHPHKTGLLLLNNLLGGNGMSSILNLQIRERHGIAYTIESGYVPLSDTGLFSIYFGTDKEKVPRTLQLVYREFKKLRDNGLNELQLQRAKHKLIGQIALGEENRIGLIISMAKSLCDHGYVDSLDVVFAKIEAVSRSQIHDIIMETLDERELSSLTFSPAPE